VRAAPWAATFAASALLLGACGDDDDSSKSSKPVTTEGPALELSIRADDGAGSTTSGRIVCRSSGPQATGDFAGGKPAAKLCQDARSLTALLTAKPVRRICTKLYAGPQTAHVTGTIDGRKIDKKFGRADGCQIKDYGRLTRILPR
jgi:hypothetical protein